MIEDGKSFYNKVITIWCLTCGFFAGDVDLDTYEEDQFDDDEAQEIKNASQLKKEQQQMLASSGPPGNVVNRQADGDALDLGEEYEDDEDEDDNEMVQEVNNDALISDDVNAMPGQAIVPASMAQRDSNPYNPAGPNTDQGNKKKPYRLNSQQNKR